jgi:TetR/AcrR family transcriptional regulator, regulator of autoinduction and epiphytic fitness
MVGVTALEPPNQQPATDGRRARGERTRAALIGAFVQLIRDGELKPTGAQIAAQAGTSLRALWANFADLETLYEATGKVLLAEYDRRTATIPADLPLPDRIDKFCRQRAVALENIGPFARANRLREPFSAALRHNRRMFLDRVATEIERLFAPELAAAGERRDEVVRALTASTSWSWWVVLRDDYDMDARQGREVMRVTVTKLLS